jgi:HD-GYP domain-containing protein (c-di-GMP phosphodiesterase class II)
MRARIIKEVSMIFMSDFKKFEGELQVLEKIRKHDEYTYLHSMNVTRLSVTLGRRMGFSEEMIEDLGWAALLHDLGKTAVPLSVLNKATKFVGNELAVMQSHPVEGQSVMAKNQMLTLDRLRRFSGSFEHHQRYDLKGYPKVHKKMNLDPYSRIIAICDTFDAMTTDRVYQKRILSDVALRIMAQGFGTIFDPVCLQAFITGMGAFPVGTLVKLSNHELALVYAYSYKSQIDRPQIVMIKDCPNNRIDLMDPAHRELKIVRSEFPEDYDINIHEILRVVHEEKAS